MESSTQTANFCRLSEDEMMDTIGGFWGAFFGFVGGVYVLCQAGHLMYDWGKECGSDFYKITHH